MKPILQEIVKILKTLPKMNRDYGIGIINPLDTEEQALKMLNYLKENRDNPELMRIDRLMKKAFEISEEGCDETNIAGNSEDIEDFAKNE